MIQIPKRRVVNTGEQCRVYEEINDFFNSVQQEIESKLGKGTYFERRTRGLYRQERPEVIPLDDNIHILLYKERVIALVTETRDEMNCVQFDFFQNLESLVS